LFQLQAWLFQPWFWEWIRLHTLFLLRSFFRMPLCTRLLKSWDWKYIR